MRAVLGGVSVLLLACGSEPEPTEPSLKPSVVTATAVSYTPINLGTLGGMGSEAHGASPAGHIVGASLTASGYHHAFLWKDGVMTDLETEGINASGMVVGQADVAGTGSRAVLVSNGTLRNLGTLGGDYGGAWDVNRWGEVVGISKVASGAYRAESTTPDWWWAIGRSPERTAPSCGRTGPGVTCPRSVASTVSRPT